MDDRDLEALLGDLESDRVERKESVVATEKICQAICAFANDLPEHRQPGVLFIGVTDKGQSSHLQVTDRLLRTLSAMRDEGNILPFPQLSVQKKTLSGCDLAVVIVQPSDSPPVRYKGVVWVRVGPRRATATAEEERRLSEKRRAGDLPFDLRPMPSATLDDLDLNQFIRSYLPASISPQVLEENQRTVEQQLASLRFATAQNPPCPTVVGLMVVGRDPRQFVPGLYVQFLRIDGNSLIDPVKDQKEIDGPLPELLRQLDEVLRLNISTPVAFKSTDVEQRAPDYPLAALQQLARNAIMHRTYETSYAPVRIYWFNDRIEIHNPGGPFGQVKKRDFEGTGITDYRNPTLAEAMKNLGFVQRFGVGILTAQDELKKNGNPPLEFTVEPDFILATLRRKP